MKDIRKEIMLILRNLIRKNWEEASKLKDTSLQGESLLGVSKPAWEAA